MEVALIAVGFGLIAAICWGISDFLIGKSSRLLGPIKGALLVNTTGALVYALVYALFLRSHATFTSEGVLYVVVAGICFGLAQATFFKAMHIGPIGLVSSVSSVYPLVTLIVGALFFSARLSLQQILGIVFVVGGISLASGFSPSKSKIRTLNRGPLLALVPVLGWGVGWVLISQAVETMSWQPVLFIELCVTATTLLILTPLVKGKESVAVQELKVGWHRPIIWAAAIIQTLGMLGVYLGIHARPDGAAIVVAISSSYPALTIFLALMHLHERIPPVPLAGGVLGVIGIVILSLG